MFSNLAQQKALSKCPPFQTGLRESVPVGNEVVTNMWTEDYSEEQYKVYFDSTENSSGKPVIQGAYLLINK